jgi:hypothetical protein
MITQILIGLFLIGLPVYFLFTFRIKKKEREKERKAAENKFVGNEGAINRIVQNYMQVDVPIIVVRSIVDTVPHYGNKTWSQIEKQYGVKAKAFYHPKLKHVVIRKFEANNPSANISDETFFKLLVHELNHHHGFNHGSEMTSEDTRLIDEIRPLLEEKNLI